MSRTTEDTPLLSDPTADELGSPTDERYERYAPNVERHQQRCTRTIFILTWSSALLAAFILVLDLTLIFVFLARFGNIMPWRPEGDLLTLLWTLLAAGLISFLNLARLYLWDRPIWLWLNLILDVTIAIFLTANGLSALGVFGSQWDKETPLWFIRITQVVSFLAVGFGLIHVALFLVRCFLSFTYRPWRGYRNWSLPWGRFSIEFKVQFSRQPDNTEALPDATVSGTGIQTEVAVQRV